MTRLTLIALLAALVGCRGDLDHGTSATADGGEAGTDSGTDSGTTGTETGEGEGTGDDGSDGDLPGDLPLDMGTPEPDPFYYPCSWDGDCAEGQVCAKWKPTGFCTVPCVDDQPDQCPPVPDGAEAGVEVTCLTHGGVESMCALACGTGITCPNGLGCGSLGTTGYHCG